MTTNAILQIGLYVVVLVALVKPLGRVHGPSLRGQAVRAGQDPGPAGTADLSPVRRRSDRRDVVEALRVRDAGVQLSGPDRSSTACCGCSTTCR